MARLIYSAIASADGYVEDAAGSFDWAAPDEELHCFVNDLERPVGTYLYGRRMYETMLYRETAHTAPGQPSFVREFTGIWQAAEKIVFSKTLKSVSSARTRIEPNFDPGIVRQLKSATEHDMTVGGADLAGQAIKAGLVDELQLFLVPIVVGGRQTSAPQRCPHGSGTTGHPAVRKRYCLPQVPPHVSVITSQGVAGRSLRPDWPPNCDPSWLPKSSCCSAGARADHPVPYRRGRRRQIHAGRP
jgi:dihydrofolate reductase